MKKHDYEKSAPIEENPTPEGGVVSSGVIEGARFGVSEEEGVKDFHEKEHTANLVRDIKHKMGGEIFPGPKNHEISDSYEVNGIAVNTKELRDVVETLTPENYGLTKDIVVDALEISEYAQNNTAPYEVQKRARMVTTANAFFGAGLADEIDPAQLRQMGEAQEVVRGGKGISGFSEWVSKKGKKLLAPLLATAGLGIALPASAGSSQYESRAAATGVRVLGSVLGTKAEGPFRIQQDVGNIGDRAENASRNADIELDAQERQVALKKRAQLERVDERVKLARANFTVEYKMYKIKNPKGTEEDFVATTKKGEALYKQVLLAEERASIDAERIQQGSRDEQHRAEERRRVQGERIQAQADRDVQRSYRQQSNRELSAMGSGARDVVRGIFRR